MKLAILPAVALLILVAAPIEQPIAGLSPLESFAKGFMVGLWKSLKGIKHREGARRRTFSGSASANLSFGGQVTPLGSSAQNGRTGSRVDLSGNLNVEGRKFPVTRPDGRRIIRKQYDGTVNFDANFTRLSQSATTAAPVVNIVPVVRDIVTHAPQEVYIKPESEEILIIEPEPEPIPPPVVETEPILPSVEFSTGVEEIPAVSVDSNPETIILTESDSIPETDGNIRVKIIQSNDDLSHLNGVFNLNVANTGTGTGAVIHIYNKGSGAFMPGPPSSVLEPPLEETDHQLAIQVDTGSSSTALTEAAAVDAVSTDGDDYLLGGSGVSIPEYDYVSPSDSFDGANEESAPVDSTGYVGVLGDNGSTSFDSFFVEESASDYSDVPVSDGTAVEDYVLAVDAPDAATVDDYGDGETLGTTDYSDTEYPVPVVSDHSDTSTAGEAVVVDSQGPAAGSQVAIVPDVLYSTPNGAQPGGGYVVETLTHAQGTTADDVDTTVSVSGSPAELYAHYVQANVDSVRELSNIALRHGNGLPLTIRLRTRHRVATSGLPQSTAPQNIAVGSDHSSALPQPSAPQNIAVGSLYNGQVMMPNGKLYAVKKAPLLHKYSEVIESPDAIQEGSVSDHGSAISQPTASPDIAAGSDHSSAIPQPTAVPDIAAGSDHSSAIPQPTAVPDIAVGSLYNGQVMIPYGKFYAVKKAQLLHKYSDVIESPDAIQVGSASDHSIDAVIGPEENEVGGRSAAKSIINTFAATNEINENVKNVRNQKTEQSLISTPSQAMPVPTKPARRMTPPSTSEGHDRSLQFLSRFAEAHRLAVLRNAQDENSASIKRKASHNNSFSAPKTGRTMNRHSTFEGELYRDRLHEVLSESGVEQRSLTHFQRANASPFQVSGPMAPGGASHGKSASLVADPVEVSSLDRKENSGITRAKIIYRQREVVPPPQV